MQKKSKIWKVSTDLTAVEVAEGIKCLPPKHDDWSENMVTSCNPSSREQTQNPQGKLASQTRWNWWAPGSARDSVSINNCKVTGKNKQTNITLTSTMASTCTCTHTIASTKKGIKTKKVLYNTKIKEWKHSSPVLMVWVQSLGPMWWKKRKFLESCPLTSPCFLCYIHMHTHTHIHKINV